MVADGFNALLVGLEAADDIGTDARVLLDLPTFLVAQLSWLFQRPISGANLTQVVDVSRGNDGFFRWARNLGHCAKDGADMFRNPNGVLIGIRIAPFQSVGQAFHRDPGFVMSLLDTLKG